MKNQIIAYVSATVIMAVVIAGAGIGIHKGITSYQDKKNARELQAQLEEMSAQQEEPVVVEAPAASPEEETQEQLSPLDEIVNAQIETMPIEDHHSGSTDRNRSGDQGGRYYEGKADTVCSRRTGLF